ncbi:pseudouridine synthase PUS5 Ecym_4187 [Eremothecium cymbalariae DBVPG|uniref:21S rRNA pseudouridine(2819) synthase n=1 Tax=Eremothecium cymbalariae (strain CBS 270.75 / DBVPG 7215 / KCTC 17166 / NRRL Y-17582) TaxID=931890 RepID=G8JTB0_ERECY|nr:hypothetical protein Ecym_4187 [Eremothecium cymbalariae DBVPG\
MTRWNLPILFQNKHYIIVNKPNGVLSQSPDLRTWWLHHKYEPPVLMDLLRTQYPDICQAQWRTVHRLDATVTGGILISCTRTAASKFSKNLALGGNSGYKFTRKYIALVTGSSIDSFPDEGRLMINDMVSDYKRLGDNLVLFQLHTGKKHQIRIQLSKVFQQPIVNDVKYGADAIPNLEDIIGLHSALISTEIGLTRENHLIPIPCDSNARKLWNGYVDANGEFNDLITESLYDFSLPSRLDRILKITPAGSTNIQIAYKSKIGSF